jgi:hypothetical protein
MSQRGLILALQRFHDDPGFADLIAQDPQSTLGIYDLDDDERQALMNMDEAQMRQLAASVGLDWNADQVSGVGTLDEGDESTEATKLGVKMPNAMTGDGYQGNRPIRTAGS